MCIYYTLLQLTRARDILQFILKLFCLCRQDPYYIFQDPAYPRGGTVPGFLSARSYVKALVSL